MLRGFAGSTLGCARISSHFPWELTSLPFQVRRMVGALVAVGIGKLKPYHIKELLEVRDSLAYPQNTIAPAAGLFLKSVEYDDAGK